MKHNRIYTFAVCLALLAVEWSCSKESGPGGEFRENVRVEFKLPSSMGSAVPVTRVMPLDTMTIYPLPEGTTLWLTISEKQSDNSWIQSEPKPYVVLASEAGYNSLHACSFTEFTENGIQVRRVDPATVSSPLYLKNGTYKFRMIAPALDMTADNRTKVDNGIYFYSTDDRYTNTQAKEQTIVVTTSGTQNIELNPMIQQVARMQFTLYKGDNITSLEMMPAGIEISGIQNAEEAEPYNWSSENIADTLKMKMGSKRGRIIIRQFRQGATSVTESGGIVVQKECLIGDTGVLPTDARSSSISVLLNLRVNGIPTQYMLLLNGQVLRAAYTYNYRIAVSMENGVVVATWTNYSWGIEVPLQ